MHGSCFIYIVLIIQTSYKSFHEDPRSKGCPISVFVLPGKIYLSCPNSWVGLLPNTRAYGYSFTAFVTNRRLFRKLHHQTLPRRTSVFLLLNSGYHVSVLKVIALNRFIQYSHCQVVQLFRLTFLSKTFTTIITKPIFCPCVRLSG